MSENKHIVKFHPRRKPKTVICGKYTDVEELTRGGSGRILRARDSKGRFVAIKELPPPPETGSGENDQGRSSSDLLDLWINNSFHHPNLVHAIDTSLDCDNENPGSEAILRLILPFAHSTLESYLSNLNNVPGEVRIEFLHDLLCGLAQLHASKLAHGDIKPGNVLLFPSAQDEKRLVAKWTDFGSVIPLLARSNPEVHGTPTYTPPELSCNKKRQGVELMKLALPADMWSMGLLALEILLGQTLEDRYPVGPGGRRSVPGIVKSHCPDAPSNEWLSTAICLIGLPPKGWTKTWDRRGKEGEKDGPCAQELSQRDKRTRSTVAMTRAGRVGDVGTGLLDRLSWSASSGLNKTEFNEYLTLIKGMLRWDPMKRLTVQQALDSKLFQTNPGRRVLECKIDLDAGKISDAKTNARLQFRYLPQKTQELTRQFANLILTNTMEAGLKMHVGETNYEFAAALIAAKLLYDPIQQNLIATASTWVSPEELFKAERRLIAISKGQFTGQKG